MYSSSRIFWGRLRAFGGRGIVYSDGVMFIKAGFDLASNDLKKFIV